MLIPKKILWLTIIFTLGLFPLFSYAASQSKLKSIPEPLKAWEGWATWDNEDTNCPTPYDDAKKHLCFWPSRLTLQVDRNAGRFDLNVTVFAETWIPLPGGNDAWPIEVKVNGTAVPVIKHNNNPSIQLIPGIYRIEGSYRWDEIPQSILLPHEIGILALTVDGLPIASPTWDARGLLWLKRNSSSEENDKDFLTVKIYSLIEDGIPLWLRTEIELVVSGKSREEDIGSILPEGWKLAAVDSPIPIVVDDAGRMRAQVRAGKWTVKVNAFRLDDPKEFGYTSTAKPAAKEQLIAFRARPDFRMVDIIGSPSIDVSQTTFPDKWRDLPVYRWDTSEPFRIQERMRGMGMQKPEGLNITRELWLDENGHGLTFRDRISGKMQQIWRLDAAPGEDLGSVRSNGQGQLITRNPQNKAPGIEIRTRDVNLEAIGRTERNKGFSATGWRSDADALNVTLNLPPGWRLFALFGADWIKGDWLTAWTLLDLFLLLIFTLAVFRLWSGSAAILAFLAFGLSYHEPGAPRYIWLILLMPLALLRVVPSGWGHRILVAWKWLTITALLLSLVPFLARQIEQALYPQLENADATSASIFPTSLESNRNIGAPQSISDVPAVRQEERGGLEKTKDSFLAAQGIARSGGKAPSQKENLQYDTKARIQTGPGVPDWKWRTVNFGWNGPVLATQEVHPILISLFQERLLAILRVTLLLALAGVLLNSREFGRALFRLPGKPMLLFAFFISAATSMQAQIPDESTLLKLRERLLVVSDAYPNAADIPHVSLMLKDHRVSMDVEIHTAIRTAVPLPGRLPIWSPISVIVDGKADATLRREDGYIWIVLSEGIHHVHVEGVLAAVTEWEWTFQLKPHHVNIDASGWTFSGVQANGVPEQQIFFVLQQKSTTTAASYDRQDFQTVVAIDRQLELGLLWQVRTTVTRLSSEGKAIALRVPLLAGENVLSSNAVIKNGFIEIRLGSHEQSFTWESELAVVPSIKLETKADDSWVERWHLVVSPIWNVAISGLPPVFEPGNPELVPVWHPWPGEQVELAISRPEAIEGATVTVNNAAYEIALGQRQRVSKLNLSVRCSLGEDFLVELPADAEVTSLIHNSQSIPVRKDGSKVIIPLRPGDQLVSIGWKINAPLGIYAGADKLHLPTESANVNTMIQVPENRWILWANGPLRGPAVQFWGILLCSLLGAWVLGRIALSPLRSFEWMLLAIGLTQVPLPAALLVVGWLFFLGWRGCHSYLSLPALGYNMLQLFLIFLTAIVLGIFVTVVGEGLLGNPEMFVSGNSSTRTVLRWYQARCDEFLPRPGCISISIWWYRVLMLAWALWLAASLVKWIRWAWQQFSAGGCFRRMAQKRAIPPPL